VLIVTPVIFFWIRQRQLGLHGTTPDRAEGLELRAEGLGLREGQSDDSDEPKQTRRWGRIAIVLLFLAVAAGAGWAWWTNVGGRSSTTESASTADIVQTVKSGDIEIVLRTTGGVLRQGRNNITVEARSAGSRSLVDVGSLRVTANMPMPGMVMSSRILLQPAGVAGRSAGTAEFDMAGAWQFAIEWDGPAGRGSTVFEGKVQ
jgi:hypothetical protein